MSNYFVFLLFVEESLVTIALSVVGRDNALNYSTPKCSVQF